MLPSPKNNTFTTYTFGSIMVSVSKREYRYGMNTQEKDNEIYGEGNSYSAEYWQYDARLGRRWNVDPKDVPSFSPYSCFANNPIWFSDVAGDSAVGTTATTQSKVQSGEGPYQFAKRNNISPEQLIKYNKDVFPEGYKKGTWLINPGQKLNTTDPNQPSSSFTPSSLGKFSTTLNTPKSAFGDHSRISFSSKTSGETASKSTESKLPWWLESDGFTGHSDPALSASNASGAVWQFGGTVSGLTGGVFVGMSKSDGFNLGFYGGGEFNTTDWGVGFTTQAASGDFTWKNYSKTGTNVNVGFGSVAYSYSEGGMPFGEKSKYTMHGLSFSFGTSRFKTVPNANLSSGVTYTVPLLK
jgi:hypothetical protein